MTTPHDDAVLAAHKAWIADCIAVLRRFTRCPLAYEHRRAQADNPRELRWDCANGQCSDPACIRVTQCNRPEHDAAQLVAAYDACRAAIAAAPGVGE